MSDGLREAVAQALVASDASVHGSYAWDECGWELRDDYRRYADAVLALPEVAALRAKAAAADRVQELAEEMDKAGRGEILPVSGAAALIRRALAGEA